ncbi:DUF4399 domain-containing protein [Shimia sp. MMG029]|uniref:DUF4399 domain-containing protein n=1 Tax=Shimia sp. MMG029 TaxID=3021978 RepID=UPI0022FE46A2|nr:DUF4399 domain-containing protein [Shimia sp. MMG029]MDA5558371.1 DUF4399 domain-containing protein [Shimia sp. MMG029]
MKHLFVAALIAIASQGVAGGAPSPEGAEVYFVNLSDGDTVQSPVLVQFGLSGMGVAPAGTEVENTGHHHIFINRPPLGEGAEDADLLENGVPTDDNHRHFGGGQTEVTLELPAGTHTLQLVLGDEFHVPHTPPVVSDVITITVD